MAIEITRSPLRIDQLVGHERLQVLVESDIIVPDDKPDIGKILDISGRVVINSKEVIQDKVMVEGSIKYNILYLAEDDDKNIASIESDASFTSYLDISGVRPKMIANIKAELEHVDCEIINSRKTNTKAVIDMESKVYDMVQLEVIDGFGGKEHIEVLSNTIVLSYEGGRGDAQTIIRESLELSDNMPTIVEILRRDMTIKELECRSADNKVVINGLMDVGFLYICEDTDYPIHYFSEQIEFVHVVDIAGVYQGMDCAGDVWIEDIYIEPREDLNGDLRLVDVEALLFFEVSAIERKHKEIITDAYKPNGALDVKLKDISLMEIVGEGESHEGVRESIILPENMPRCDRVLHIDAKAVMLEQALYDDRAVIEGVIAINILYSSDEIEGIVSFKQDIPFNQTIDIEGIDSNMYCDSRVQIERMNFSLIAPDEIEFKAAVNGWVRVYDEIKVNVVVDIEEIEGLSDDQSGMFVYFVKQGDTLWSIAKQYNTTIDNILRFNDLSDGENLEIGKRIIIYNKYDYKMEEMSI
ncbi:MAG TPA: DUF3794 domain-containing protein [Clostridiales bacterium]|nr:DUF3794 domain-containing protein [Clostridiales bacterium]